MRISRPGGLELGRDGDAYLDIVGLKCSLKEGDTRDDEFDKDG